jgi:hypothetical protein
MDRQTIDRQKDKTNKRIFSDVIATEIHLQRSSKEDRIASYGKKHLQTSLASTLTFNFRNLFLSLHTLFDHEVLYCNLRPFGWLCRRLVLVVDEDR